MIGSVQCVCRLVAAPPSVSAMLFVISILVPTDSTRRSAGYAGVLPLPIGESSTNVAPLATFTDQLLDQRRDARAERGRVLYAAGHAPANPSPSAAQHTARESRTCQTHAPHSTFPGSAGPPHTRLPDA